MPYNKIIKISTLLVIIFGFLSFAGLILGIGGGGVLNDLYLALEEIEDLEKKNLLHNPPENISSIAKRELKLSHNSSGLRKYIKETEESLSDIEICFYGLAALFFLSLILRIYFRKEKR